MSGWTEFDADGVLADAEITDFLPSGPYGPDARLCVLIKYLGTTPGQLRIFSAPGAGAAERSINDIYNSATQLNPGADLTLKLNDTPSHIIIEAGVPWTLRITKGDGDATVWWASTIVSGPGC